MPSFSRPLTPDHVAWNEHYPAYLGPQNVPIGAAAAASSSEETGVVAVSRRSPLSEVRIADVGCGFGGMTVALGEIFPDKLVLALEIRDKVVDIVKDRVVKLRAQAAAAKEKGEPVEGEYHVTESASPSPAPWVPHAASYRSTAAPFTYQNISCVKVNFMKYAPNYFRKGQLEKIFFLFADPHFKKANFRRRVIGTNFLAIYAYILQVGGMLYTITDVLDLHQWQVEHLDKHPLFERIPDADLQTDPCFLAMHSATQEGQKVTRQHGSKYPAVYRRIEPKQA